MLWQIVSISLARGIIQVFYNSGSMTIHFLLSVVFLTGQKLQAIDGYNTDQYELKQKMSSAVLKVSPCITGFFSVPKLCPAFSYPHAF